MKTKTNGFRTAVLVFAQSWCLTKQTAVDSRCLAFPTFGPHSWMQPNTVIIKLPSRSLYQFILISGVHLYHRFGVFSFKNLTSLYLQTPCKSYHDTRANSVAVNCHWQMQSFQDSAAFPVFPVFPVTSSTFYPNMIHSFHYSPTRKWVWRKPLRLMKKMPNQS